MAETPIPLAEFLEAVPPGRLVLLDQSSFRRGVSRGSIPGDGTPYLDLVIPQIRLYCGEPHCNQLQRFSSNNTDGVVVRSDHFLSFTCRNCAKTRKIYAVRFFREGDADPAKVSAQKYGEMPQFGPPLPAKLLQLADTYADLLKKGRQSENQSLGIGAFAYYRRVVEQQKSRLVDELANAIQRLGGNKSTLDALERARAETQFTKALELMADVLPKELFVSGQNPLKLLHGPAERRTSRTVRRGVPEKGAQRPRGNECAA